MSARGVLINGNKGTGNYQNKDALDKLVKYVCRVNRDDKDLIDCIGFGVDNEADLSDQIDMMNMIQRINGIEKRGGKRAEQLIFSIKEDQFRQFGCNPQLVAKAFREMGATIYEDGYQVYVGSHYNPPCDDKEKSFMHAHYIINSINYCTGWKFRKSHEEKYIMQDNFDQILDKYQQMSPVTFSNLDAFIQTDPQYCSLYER